MSLHADVINHWACPFPFYALHLSSEHDEQLGQWCIDFAILGIGLSLTWVYDDTTELRKELADMMADESWLDKAMVSLPHADYKAMKDKADKWEALQK